jgi:hypothetical protein
MGATLPRTREFELVVTQRKRPIPKNWPKSLNPFCGVKFTTEQLAIGANEH